MILSKRPRAAGRSAKPRSSSSLCISLVALASVGATFALTSSASADSGQRSKAQTAKDCTAAALKRPGHMRIVRKPGTKTIFGPAMTLPKLPVSCGGKRTVRYGLEGKLKDRMPDFEPLGRLWSVQTNESRKLNAPDTVAIRCDRDMRGLMARPYANITYRRNGKIFKEQYPKEGEGPKPKLMCKSSRRSTADPHRLVVASTPRDSGTTDAEEPPTPGTPVPLPGEEPAPTASPKSEEEKACADKALLAPTGISGKYKVYENYAWSYKLVAKTSVLPKSCKKFGKLILTGLQQVSDKHHDWRPGSNELLLATNPAKRARVSRTLRAPRNCWKGGLFGDPDKKNKTVGRAAVKSTWIPKHGKTLIAFHHAKAKKLCK